MSIISKDIHRAKKILESDNLVAIPTETVYGLAGNIYSEKAIRKIFQLKQRPLYNPLIVHTYAVEQVGTIVSYIPPKAKLLMEAFWPGSLTLILPKKPQIPDLITAGKATVGVRIPNHPLTLELLRRLDFPLAAPSANPFTRISPTEANHVANYFKENLPMVLDGGPCTNGIESTIIGFEGETPVLYRLGSIAIEDIEKIVGPIAIKNNKEKAPVAPGMLARHYAPKTKTVLVKDVATYLRKFPNKQIATLTFKKEVVAPNVKLSVTLSPTGNLKQAAARLYGTLHQLDRAGVDLIVAERFPDTGLGVSINDRLERATK